MAPDKTGQFAINYQALARCSEAHGESINIDFSRQNVTTVYPDIGKAEMYARVLLIDFDRVNDHTTNVAVYRHGAAERVTTGYFEVFAKCERGELK